MRRLILGDSFDCAQCGKHVETLYLDEWAYKIRSRKKPNGKSRQYVPYYFCTWKCMRKWEDEHIKPKDEWDG